MKENELIHYVHKDSSMSVYMLDKILEALKMKNNKIKPLLEEIRDEYREYAMDSTKELNDEEIKKAEEVPLCKFLSNLEINNDIKMDNSDSAVADILIKAISTSNVELEKLLIDEKEEKDADKDHKKTAKKYEKFQNKTIDKLKKYL